MHPIRNKHGLRRDEIVDIFAQQSYIDILNNNTEYSQTQWNSFGRGRSKKFSASNHF